MFAMARDNALPFGEKLARVSSTTQTPIVPAIVIGVLAIMLLVINIGNQIFTVLDVDRDHHDLPGLPVVTGPMLKSGCGAMAAARGGQRTSPSAAGACWSTSFAVAWGRRGAQPGLAARRRVRRADHWYNPWGAFVFIGGVILGRAVVLTSRAATHRVLAEHSAMIEDLPQPRDG